MNKNYDWAIDFIEKSKIVKLLAIPGTIFGFIYWFFGFFHGWVSKDLVDSDYWELWRGLFSLIATLAIICQLHIGYIYFINKKYRFGAFRIIINPFEIFEKELPQSNNVRIFASNGEAAKNLFLDFRSKKNSLMHNLNVQVLLRSINGDINRESHLKDQVQRWKTDVDDLLSESNLKMQTSFKLWECPVMLAGYIFDDRVAMLAWYSRPEGTNRHRSLAKPPLVYLSSEDPDSKKLLDEAIKLFDCHYNSGKELQ